MLINLSDGNLYLRSFRLNFTILLKVYFVLHLGNIKIFLKRLKVGKCFVQKMSLPHQSQTKTKAWQAALSVLIYKPSRKPEVRTYFQITSRLPRNPDYLGSPPKKFRPTFLSLKKKFGQKKNFGRKFFLGRNFFWAEQFFFVRNFFVVRNSFLSDKNVESGFLGNLEVI